MAKSEIRNHKSEIPLRGYVFIVLAASLWGSIGLFLRVLHDQHGLSETALAFLRPAVAGALLLPALALIQPRALKLPRRSLPLFILFGLNATAYNLFYVQAIVQIGVTTAAILLYTAPAIVTLIAWRLWGEPIHARKLIAIALAFAGCFFVARGYDFSQLQVNAWGIAFGLGAGIAYALYSLMSKAAMREHSALTTLAYVLLFASLFLAPLQTPSHFAPLTRDLAAWIPLLGLALGPTIGALVLFNLGLRRVPASNASVLATIEPVVASALSFVILGERLEIPQMLGAGLVIGGAVLLSANT